MLFMMVSSHYSYRHCHILNFPNNVDENSGIKIMHKKSFFPHPCGDCFGPG